MSFLVDLRTKQVEGEHQKAVSIFSKAIQKFEKAIASANDHIEKNKEEMRMYAEEVDKRAASNVQMHNHISAMQNSINKIKSIVGDV